MQPNNSNTDFQQASETRLHVPLGQLPEQFGLPEQFEVVEQLGHGGMGIVYKARNKFTDRIVAIKMLPASVYSEQSLMRFQREAKAISAFTHVNAVALYDFGLCSDQSPYFVMEFVEGETLAARLERANRIDENTVLEIFKQVCGVLAHAHDAGVIHRDLKPSNFMLTDKNVVKILDFGIAKIVKLEEIQEEQEPQKLGRYGAESDLTKTGAVMGTPLYMSPEQCLGADVDARSDIYSVGAVMYHCLTGVPPHSGTTIFETLHKRVTEDAEPFAKELNISPKLEQLVLGCLARNMADRPESANVLLNQLITFKSSSSHTDERKKIRKNAAIVAGIVFILAIAAVAIVISRSAPVSPLALDTVPGATMPAANQSSINATNATLQLNGRVLTPNQWRAVGKTPFVLQLKLANSNLTNETFAYLKGLHYVRDLDISNTRFSDLSALADSFPLLQTLNLLRLDLSGPSTQALSKLKFLKELDVSRTKITASGITALQKLEKLEKLRFVRSDISDDTYEAIGRLTQLKCLDLWKSNTNNHRLSLLVPLRNLTELRIGDVQISNAGMNSIAKFPVLEKLELNGNHAIDDNGVMKLRTLKLKKLALAETGITDDCADVLSQMGSLTDLNMRGTKITDKGVMALAKLTNLEKLNLENTAVTDARKNALQAALPKLRIEQ